MKAAFIALMVLGCGDDSSPTTPDSGGDAAADGAEDASREDSAAGDSSAPDANPDARPDGARPGDRGSVLWVLNGSGAHDYSRQLVLPPTFGEGEFTLEVWIRPDSSFPFGSTAGGEAQLRNWSDADIRPYDNGQWWYEGNFLLDGHNNISSFSEGTFSLQFYGSGRVRFLFGDGNVSEAGGVWNAGAFPATSTPSIVDDAWHHLAAVRRYSGGGASIELWVDGVRVGEETRVGQVDMRAYWDTWAGFSEAQAGWFWGAEKQAAVGLLSQYEDFKGLMAELRFWDAALSADRLSNQFNIAVDGTEANLVGWFPFDEGMGTQACDAIDRGRCMDFVRTSPNLWSSDVPPLR